MDDKTDVAPMNEKDIILRRLAFEGLYPDFSFPQVVSFSSKSL